MTDKTSDVSAVILLGHGSRASGAAEDMERVVERLKEELDCGIVDICQMSGLGDHFPEVFDRCVARGATSVFVIPYFLHFGVHLRQDVPAMMMEKAQEYPNIRLVLGPHLGFDDALVGIVKKRVQESEGMCDIREMELRPVDSCGCKSHHH